MATYEGQPPGSGSSAPLSGAQGGTSATPPLTNTDHRTGNGYAPRTGSPAGAGLGSNSHAALDGMKEEAGHLAERAKERGKQILSREKDDAAGTLHSVADAFRSSAERIEGEQPRRYLGMAAERLESMGQRLRDKDIDSLLGDAQDTARRAPVAFFAGSVLTGFLLARFMKSSAQRRNDSPRGSASRGEWNRTDNDRGATSRDELRGERSTGDLAATTTHTDQQQGADGSRSPGTAAALSTPSASTGGSHA